MTEARHLQKIDVCPSYRIVKKKNVLTVQERITWIRHINTLHVTIPVNFRLWITGHFALQHRRVSDLNDACNWSLRNIWKSSGSSIN